jgi:hypothetical protein
MANTLNYENPSAGGATPPTAQVMRAHQQMSAIVTGDNSATTIALTHNMAISAAQLALGYPEVEFEPLLAAGITAAPIVTTKATNTLTVTCTAFTGAGLRIRVKKPWSATE